MMLRQPCHVSVFTHDLDRNLQMLSQAVVDFSWVNIKTQKSIFKTNHLSPTLLWWLTLLVEMFTKWHLELKIIECQSQFSREFPTRMLCEGV